MSSNEGPKQFYDRYKETLEGLMDMLFCMNEHPDSFPPHVLISVLSPENLPLEKFWTQSDIMRAVTKIVALIENSTVLHDLQDTWSAAVASDSSLGAVTIDALAAIAANPHVTETTCLTLLNSPHPAIREAIRDNDRISVRVRTLAII